jgi:hypothetical protein
VIGIALFLEREAVEELSLTNLICSAVSSTMVSQAPQEVHLPIQRGDWNPQAWHSKSVFFFAIVQMLLLYYFFRGAFIAIKLSTFGAAISIAAMRINSHPRLPLN